MKNGQKIWTDIFTELTYDPAILFPGIHLEKKI